MMVVHAQKKRALNFPDNGRNQSNLSLRYETLPFPLKRRDLVSGSASPQGPSLFAIAAEMPVIASSLSLSFSRSR